ncbi:MAG: hypothetical protein ACK5HT_05590, partial [Draconibacterium sp.]
SKDNLILDSDDFVFKLTFESNSLTKLIALKYSSGRSFLFSLSVIVSLLQLVKMTKEIRKDNIN